MNTKDVPSDQICRKNQINYGMLKVSKKMSFIIHVSVVVSPGRIIRQYQKKKYLYIINVC